MALLAREPPLTCRSLSYRQTDISEMVSKLFLCYPKATDIAHAALLIEGIIVREADREEVGAQGDTIFQFQKGNVPLKIVGIILAVGWVDADPADWMVSSFLDLLHIYVAQEYINAGIGLCVLLLGVEGVSSCEDPAVAQQGSTPSAMDVVERLPGEVAHLGIFPSNDALLLYHRVDGFPTHWRRETAKARRSQSQAHPFSLLWSVSSPFIPSDWLWALFSFSSHPISLFLFISSCFGGLVVFIPWLPVCSENAGMLGLHPVLCISPTPPLSPGTSPLFSPYSSCLVSTSSWSVSLIALLPFFMHVFSGALQVTKDGSRGFPLTWQTPRNLLSFPFILPNALGCAGICS